MKKGFSRVAKLCATVAAAAAMAVSAAGCSYPSNVAVGNYKCSTNCYLLSYGGYKTFNCNINVQKNNKFSTNQFLVSYGANAYSVYKNAAGTYKYNSNDGSWKGTLTSGKYYIWQNGSGASLNITKNSKYTISASHPDDKTILFKTFYYVK